MRNTIIHTGKFNSVGQGNFFSGSFKNDDKSFNYIVDCGSSSSHDKVKIPMKIREIINEINNKIDLLDISHLDDDHINGLEHLTDYTIGTIVLPYLEPYEKLILSSYYENYNKGKFKEIDSNFVANFIIDPVGTLKKREIKYEKIVLLKE